MTISTMIIICFAIAFVCFYKFYTDKKIEKQNSSENKEISTNKSKNNLLIIGGFFSIILIILLGTIIRWNSATNTVSTTKIDDTNTINYTNTNSGATTTKKNNTTTNTTTKSNSSTNNSQKSSTSSKGCQYKYSNGEVCGRAVGSHGNLCDYHFKQLDSTYKDLLGQ